MKNLYGKILAVIENSKNSYKYLNYAAKTADVFNADLIILATYSSKIIFQDAGYGIVSITHKDYENYLKRVEKNCNDVLTDAKKKLKVQYPNLNIKTIIEKGKSPETIIKISNIHNVDLIIMENIGYSGILGLILENTSLRVAEYSTKPILIIK